MRLVFAVFALLVVGGCRDASYAVGAPPRVIMPAENLAPTAIDDHGQQAEPPYWTPSPGEVAQAESRLPAALAEARDTRAHDITEKLDDYGRQYLGVTIASRRTLVVNGFCDSWGGRYLKTRVVRVWDGGICYFTGYYDTAEGRFTSISVNAEG